MDIKERLKKEILFLDGATGTNLQRAGMPAGVCPELWILEHPDVLVELQKDYIRAGSQIIYAPTFSGNSVKLAEYGVKESVKEINRRLVALSRRAVEEAVQESGDGGTALTETAGVPDGDCDRNTECRCLVAGDITMTGRQLEPMGDMDFEELVDIYKEQVTAIAEAGADLIVVETMMSIQECRAAVLAVKESTNLPVFVTITLESNGKTLYGTEPVTALITMEALGVDAFGLNCSSGPDTMLPLIREMTSYATVPLIAKPNAGLPRMENGKTVFDMPKEIFAEEMQKLVDAGASVVGGCCGTDASYIAAMRQQIRERKRAGITAAEAGISNMEEGTHDPETEKRLPVAKKRRRLLTCERSFLEFTLDGAFHIVGERINPTGKKKLQAELLAGSLDLACDMAGEQVRQGASILDINVGMSGIDEQAMMLRMIEEAGSVAGVPLCIDSSDPEVIAAALRRYPGRALVNSVSCEKVKIEKLLPIVKKYGAMFVLLPLRDEGLPKDQTERWENIQYVWEKARALGFAKEDIIVDGLVAAVAAEPMAAKDTIATIAHCYQEGFATICGLSNISFGLPERSYVNSAFLSMAIAQGLTMAIANPSQELFSRSRLAADLLMGKELAAVRYVEDCQNRERERENQPTKNKDGSEAGQSMKHPEGSEAGQSTKNKDGSEAGQSTKHPEGSEAGQSMKHPEGSEAGQPSSHKTERREAIRQNVLKGRAEQTADEVREALKSGEPAKELLDHVLIPAINEVGELFNLQKYFLPQLILSAKAMEEGVAVLEPVLMEAQGESKGPTVVVATVKGDIHDIGKNLVVMMMRNYGFRVFDLGKDVDKETIVAAAREYHADVIGLSALMTTTMTYMKEVIEEVQRQKLDVKVIVGGAAVTPEYAAQIGADGYSGDAVEAVELVKRLMDVEGRQS